MTEAKWLKSDSPTDMLRCLLDLRVDRYTKYASERKLRLLACGMARTLRILGSPNPVKDKAVEVAENVADKKEVNWSNKLLKAREAGGGFNDGGWIWCATCLDIEAGLRQTVLALGKNTITPFCELLRDVFGNPWRLVELPKRLLTPTVLSLARGAYEERCSDGLLDFAQLGILGDALEEGGCTDDLVLGGLRGKRRVASRNASGKLVFDWLGGNSTVRGYWPLDLILGKN